MPLPITDDEREQVRHLHAEDKTRNQIARAIKRSGSTVSKSAKDIDLSFERGSEVVAATEARRLDLADGQRGQVRMLVPQQVADQILALHLGFDHAESQYVPHAEATMLLGRIQFSPAGVPEPSRRTCR